MAIIMLALGALLAIVGVYGIASGYPIIEIERGWAMLIAGAVLLSGGLIVAALGIVVRTLTGLKAGLAVAGVPMSSHLEPAGYVPDLPAEHGVRAPAMSPSMTPANATGDGVPVLAVAAPAAAVMAAARGEQPTLGLPRAADFDAFETPLRAAPEHLTDVAEPTPVEPTPVEGVPAWHEQEFSAFDDLEPEPVPPPPAEPVPLHIQGSDVQELGGHELHDHELHDHELHSLEPRLHEPHPDEPPADERYLRELGFEAPNAAPHVAEHVPEPPFEHALEPEPPVPAHPVAPEHPAEAPSTAPEIPPSNLAVIGRYDSDGTSYVMYSDGSIEAQTESRVVRFNSMAELKAFIEG